MYYHVRAMALKTNEQEEKESIVSGTLDRCVCVCVCACVFGACAFSCMCVCARTHARVFVDRQTGRQIDR